MQRRGRGEGRGEGGERERDGGNLPSPLADRFLDIIQSLIACMRGGEGVSGNEWGGR